MSDQKEDLTTEFARKLHRQRKRIEESREQGLLTGKQVLEMIICIAGGVTKDGQRTQGLNSIPNPNSPNWFIKLNNNLSRLRTYQAALQSMIPKLSDQAQKYEKERYELFRVNAGKPEGFRKDITDQDIRDQGNYEIFIEELDALVDKYVHAVEEIEERNELVEKLLKTPVIPSDFILIDPETEVPTSVSPQKLEHIWPMIKGAELSIEDKD